MPVLTTKEYDTSLIDMNENVYYLYVNADSNIGGGRRIVSLRQHTRGLPLTLRDDYSENGTFTVATESRDIQRIENEFQSITKVLAEGYIVCVPIYPLTEELTLLEKRSPKVAGYLQKRLELFHLRYQRAATNI